jgi:hypothetical protein
MTLDLHEALTTEAAQGADRGYGPTALLLTRVHRRRARRTALASAVSVTAVGAVAFTAVQVWPEDTAAPAPATQAPAPAPDQTAEDPTDDPIDDGLASAAPVWDLFPDSTLDLSAAPGRAVTEALAALPVSDQDGWDLYLLDAADGAWVRSPWPIDDVADLQAADLSPDGRTLALKLFDGERTQAATLDLATGTVTPIALTLPGGSEGWAGLVDFSPDGTSLAILSVADPVAGPAAVSIVDLEADSGLGATSIGMTIDGTSLAEGGALEYSPDGSLLAVTTYDVDAPYTPRTLVLDTAADVWPPVVASWPAALRGRQAWYGNDALRASALEHTDDGEWKGYLLVGSGEAVGEIRSYDEYPWVYGTPPEPLGDTHGQMVSQTAALTDGAPAEPAPLFQIEDLATGTVRTWLTVVGNDETLMWGDLLHRAR